MGGGGSPSSFALRRFENEIEDFLPLESETEEFLWKEFDIEEFDWMID